MIAGAALAVYWLSSAADRACEEFTAAARRLVASEVHHKEVRSVGVEVLFRGGEFEHDGKTYTRPPGCEAPEFP